MERDTSIDLNALINEGNIFNGTEQTEESPLDRALKNSNSSKGMVVSREEIEKGSDNKPLKAPMSDQRTEDIKNWLNNTDINIEKVKYLNKIIEPKKYEEYVEMMEELESFDCSDPNNLRFIFKKDDSYIDPKTGEEKWITKIDKDRKPKFFTIKTKEEMENAKKESESPKPTENITSSESSDENVNEENISEEKKKIVQVIIDKTGLGLETFFTQEEREKIRASEEIRVKEVREVNLSSIKIKKVTDSFQDHIKKQEFSNSRVTICFPASGFSAHMNGLTYGELGDASLSMEGITIAQYNKRLSIIYNKMSNPSCGEFKSYEDFLKHFAFTDIFMALYGLLIATFPEQSTIQLNCGKCEHSYDWDYSTRSILRLKDCDDVFLNKMSKIAHASPSEASTLVEEAAVNNCRRIEIPKSKIIFEFGIISAYEFLYNFIPIANDNDFKEEFGDRFEKFGGMDLNLLSIIRKVYVPDTDGSYIEYDNYKDIMNVVFSIDPEESILLRSIMVKMINEYQPVFEIVDVECPNCHQKTKRISVSMDDILFQTLQRLLSTTIDVSNMLSL